MTIEGCLICGKELVYGKSARKSRCSYCGREAESQIYCPDGHFICDECHGKDALAVIRDTCRQSNAKNPMELALTIMGYPAVHMHGPEHHALVPAVLVTAFQNCGGSVDSEALERAMQRGSTVPGGYCGNFGACGAGIGTGIAVSVITGATPLKVKSWAMANEMTARALHALAEKGGPRCCKRCAWTALTAAADFIKEITGVEMEMTDMTGKCSHYERNRQCLKKKCGYYPVR